MKDELGAITTEVFTLPDGGGDPYRLQTIRQSVEELTVTDSGLPPGAASRTASSNLAHGCSTTAATD